MGTLAFILFDVVQVSLVVDGVVTHGIISFDGPGGKCNVTWLDGTFSAGATHPASPPCNLTHLSLGVLASGLTNHTAPTPSPQPTVVSLAAPSAAASSRPTPKPSHHGARKSARHSPRPPPLPTGTLAFVWVESELLPVQIIGCRWNTQAGGVCVSLLVP